jgi:hypothetical protein
MTHPDRSAELAVTLSLPDVITAITPSEVLPGITRYGLQRRGLQESTLDDRAKLADRAREMIASVQKEPGLAADSELALFPDFHTPSYVAFQEALVQRLQPEENYIADFDAVKRDEHNKRTIDIQYREIPRLQTVSGFGGIEYAWYLRLATPIHEHSARYMQGGKEIMVFRDKPEQLILRRKFQPKPGK